LTECLAEDQQTEPFPEPRRWTVYIIRYKQLAVWRNKSSTNCDRTWHGLVGAIDAPPQYPKCRLSRRIDACNVRDLIYSAGGRIESVLSVQNIVVVITLRSF
jgi:hypothetical protein